MTFIHVDGPSPDRGHAPALPPHDFSPSAVMARADAHAAEQARRVAAKSRTVVDWSPAEILAAIAAEVDRQRDGGAV